MKRDFLKQFEGLSDETIDAIMSEAGKDIEREKAKADQTKSDLEAVRQEVNTYKDTIAQLEAKKGEAEGMAQELEALKTKIAQDEAAAQAAAADKQQTEAINAVFGDKKFTSDYVRNGLIADIKAEIKKPENTGKGYSEIFEALTKDKTGLFVQEQQISGIQKPNGVNTDVAEDKLRAVMGLSPKQ